MINKLWLPAALLMLLGSAQSAFAFDFAYDMPQFQYGIHYKWSVGQWVEDSRWTPHYTNALFDSMFVEAYVNQTYIPYDRAHVSYAGSMLSIVNQSIFDGTSWSGQQVDSFTYFGNRIQYQDVMVYKNGVLQTHHLFTHSYDGSGRRIERLEEDLYPGQRRNDDDWRYSYDASGRIDTIYDNDWDGTQWVFKAREVYLYGAAGELDTVTREYYSNGSWSPGEFFVVNGAVASGASHLTVQPLILFDTLAGRTQTKSIVLTNTGTVALSLPGFMMRSGSLFSLSDTSVRSIAAGASDTISLAFAPKVSGPFYDTVVIGPVDAPLALVAVMGIGEMGKIEISKDTTKLSATVGGSDTELVAVTNHGDVPVMITVVRVLNTPNDFSTQGVVDPIQLGAGQSTNLSVYYSPTASSAASSSATVEMTFTDGGLRSDTTFVLEGSTIMSGVKGVVANSFSFDLFPNPAAGFVVIANAAHIRDVRFIDGAGNVVLKQNISGSSQHIDISSLASGSYFVECSYADGTTSTQRLNVRR